MKKEQKSFSAAIADEFVEKAINSAFDECEVRLDYDYPPLEYTLSINGVETAPKGNIIAITGQAKVGKSRAMGLLAKVLLEGVKNTNNQVLYGLHGLIEAPVVLYFDTEMDERDTQDWGRRVQKSCNWNERRPHPRLHVFNLKGYPKELRKVKIEEQITKYNPDEVIIDGVRDLVDDFNNIAEVSTLINWLQGIICQSGAAIYCLIHQNRQDKQMRGHLGSELLNKCYVSLSISKTDKNGTSVFTLKEEVTRGKSFGSISFTLDEEGLPIPLEKGYKPQTEKKNEKKDKNRQDITMEINLLKEIYAESTTTSLSNGQIKDAWMDKTGKSSSSFGRAFAKYKEANYLTQTHDKRYELNV